MLASRSSSRRTFRDILAVAVAALFFALPAPAGSVTLQLFLSADDPGALPFIPNTGPPNYPDLDAPAEYETQSNPVLTGNTRLWIWARPFAPFSHWSTVSFNIDGDGPLTLSNLTFFNPNYFVSADTSLNRWRYVIVPNPSPDGSNYDGATVSALDAAGEYYGIRAIPYQDGYRDGTSANVLLGYFDAAYEPISPASLWLEVGTHGIFWSGKASMRARFGFGDESIYSTGPSGTRSALPEAVFVPEPATAALILIAAVAWRRHACRRNIGN